MREKSRIDDALILALAGKETAHKNAIFSRICLALLLPHIVPFTFPRSLTSPKMHSRRSSDASPQQNSAMLSFRIHRYIVYAYVNDGMWHAYGSAMNIL